MSTTTGLAAILKVFYVEDKLHKQFNQQSVLYDKLMKKWQTDASGKSYTYGALTSGLSNAGSGYSEGGTFAAATDPGTTTIVVPQARVSTPVEVTGDLIEAAKGANKGAFVSSVRLLVEQAMKSHIYSINRQLHGDGRDALAFWTAADDVSGTAVDDGAGRAFVLLPKGGTMTCDLVEDSDNSTLRGTAIVVSRGAAAATTVAVTWTGTVTSSGIGNYLVPTGTLGKQIMGIRGVVDDGDPALLGSGLHGIAATNAYWQAQVFDNPQGTGGTLRDLTLELMQAPLTAISMESDASQNDVKFLLSNGGVFNKYIALCVQAKQHVNTMTLDGGQSAVSFNDKPLILDPVCRRGSIYYLVPESMSFLSSSGGTKWANFDGNQWRMKTGGSTQSYADAYQAFLITLGNLACKQRNVNALLTDLND